MAAFTVSGAFVLWMPSHSKKRMEWVVPLLMLLSGRYHLCRDVGVNVCLWRGQKVRRMGFTGLRWWIELQTWRNCEEIKKKYWLTVSHQCSLSNLYFIYYLAQVSLTAGAWSLQWLLPLALQGLRWVSGNARTGNYSTAFMVFLVVVWNFCAVRATSTSNLSTWYLNYPTSVRLVCIACRQNKKYGNSFELYWFSLLGH